MTNPTRPEDFGTTDCGDGIKITRPGNFYQVWKGDTWKGNTASHWLAIKFVEIVRAEQTTHNHEPKP